MVTLFLFVIAAVTLFSAVFSVLADVEVFNTGTIDARGKRIYNTRYTWCKARIATPPYIIIQRVIAMVFVGLICSVFSAKLPVIALAMAVPIVPTKGGGTMKETLKRISDLFRQALLMLDGKEKVKVNKLSRGFIPETHTVNVKGGKLVTNLIDASQIITDKMYELYMSKWAPIEIQLLVPIGIIPQLAVSFLDKRDKAGNIISSAYDEATAYMNEAASTFYRDIASLEKGLNVHILPYTKSKTKTIKLNGNEYMRMFAIRNEEGSFDADFTRVFKDVTGSIITPALLKDVVKLIDYMTTDICEDCTWEEKVVVVPTSYLRDMNYIKVDGDDDDIQEMFMDGCGIRYSTNIKYSAVANRYKACTKKELPKSAVTEHIAEHPLFKLHDYDSIQLRGKSKEIGGFVKGTVTPVTGDWVYWVFDPKHVAEVNAHLAAGKIVMTPDTAKGCPAGEYVFEMAYHKSSNSIDYITEVKLSGQFFEKRYLTNDAGLRPIVTEKAEAFCEAIKNHGSLMGYIARNITAYDDGESIPMDALVDGFEQVRRGRDLNLHISDKFNCASPMLNLLKDLPCVHIGNRNTRKLDIIKDHGIAASEFGYVGHDLGHDEVSIPKFHYRMLLETGLWRMMDHYVGRNPQIATSIRKVKLVPRDDNYPQIMVSADIASDLGMDSDGDRPFIFSVLKGTFTIKRVTGAGVELMKRAYGLTESIEKRCKPFLPKIEIPKGPKDHYTKTFTQAMGNYIGITGWIISITMKWLKHTVGMSFEERLAVQDYLEAELIQPIIDAKKHNTTETLNIPYLMTFISKSPIARFTMGDNLLRGKIRQGVSFNTLTRKVNGPEGETEAKVTLEQIPGYIKENITSPHGISWVHSTVKRVLHKNLPEKCECPRPKIDESALRNIVRELLKNDKDMVFGTLGFTHYNGKIKNGMLDRFTDKMGDIRNDDTKSPEHYQEFCSKGIALCKEWFDKMTVEMEPEAWILAQFYLVAYATRKRYTKTNASIHSWIFSYVNGIVLEAFFAMLHNSDYTTVVANSKDIQSFFDFTADDYNISVDTSKVAAEADSGEDMHSILEQCAEGMDESFFDEA